METQLKLKNSDEAQRMLTFILANTLILGLNFGYFVFHLEGVIFNFL